MNRVLLTFLALAAAAGIGAAIIGTQVQRFLHEPMTLPEEGVQFEVRAGMPFAAVSDELASRGLIDHPEWLRLYARFTEQAAAIQAGEYLIESGTTPSALIQQFVSGEVLLYSFTIVEGWTFRDMIAALGRNQHLTKSIEHEDWPALLESFGAEAEHPEGLFLPETYRFSKGTEDTEILQQAYTLMQETLRNEWAERDENLPIASPYEALVLASIVEKETALAAERPRIAGVFVRRLQKSMRLQTDPTVIYGIGVDFNGNLTRRDMRTDTPYNTYTRGGLPPTPIALPGKAAINAVLHPAAGSEIYFVATGLGDGSHQFSDTKAEHDSAVQEYLKRLRAARKNAQ